MSQLTDVGVESLKFTFPKFLSSQYFERILQKFNNDPKLKVETAKVGPCGVAGDAFASTMYRVEVTSKVAGENNWKRRNFIVKMMPTLKIAVDKLGSESYNVQEKEMDIFQNIFPEFRRILKGIGEDVNVFPIAIAVDKRREVLVLEDLAMKKFEMADRKIGMDMKHLKLGLDKLARFHAASMVLMEESPMLFDRYDVGMFSRKTSAFHDFFGTNMDALIAEVLSWNGFEVYARKLEKLKEKLYEKSYEAFDNDDGDMKVLIHGDLWVNNLMFIYDKMSLPKDAIILDFQFCCVAHPAIDLLYFLYTSSVDDIRQNNFLELTQYYFYELRNILTKLKYNLNRLPTLQQFQLQVMKKYFYAFPSSMIIFPLMMSNDPESNFENVHSTNSKALAFKQRLYKNPDLQKIIKNSLPTFDKLGLLDAE